ncbi:cation:proton antiporter [Myxococcota bacterium]
MHVDLVALLVLLAGSFLMPVLSGRIHMPSAVLLILFGVAVGPQMLNWVGDGEVVHFLYEVGFIVLMFLAGLEIDFNEIRARGSRQIVVAALICLAIFGLAFVAAFAIGFHPIFGLALGATSVGLPLAVLKETGRLRTATGQRIILLSSLGEFLTLVGMTLMYFGVKYGLSFQLVVGLAKLFGVLAVAGLTLKILMAIAWWKPTRFHALVEADDGSEIGVRAALFMMMTFSVLAILAGVESIVGAFLAGALLAFVLRGKEILEEKLAVVGHGLFVPIFFVIVGLHFDLGVITWKNLLVAGELLAAVFLVRLLPSAVLLREGVSLREMMGTASLLSAPLTLMVAIAALGLEIEALSPEASSTLIVLAVATAVIFPVAFRLLSSRRQTRRPLNEHARSAS